VEPSTRAPSTFTPKTVRSLGITIPPSVVALAEMVTDSAVAPAPLAPPHPSRAAR
jgi:hypothetical protein